MQWKPRRSETALNPHCQTEYLFLSKNHLDQSDDVSDHENDHAALQNCLIHHCVFRSHFDLGHRPANDHLGHANVNYSCDVIPDVQTALVQPLL